MPSLLGTHRTINKICPSLLPTLYFSFILLVALPNSHFPLSAITPNPLPRRQMSGSLWIRRMLSRQLGQHFTSTHIHPPLQRPTAKNPRVYTFDIYKGAKIGVHFFDFRNWAEHSYYTSEYVTFI